MAVKNIYRRLVSPERELEFKIRGLATVIEQTGVPREQALVMARQRLEKNLPIEASVQTTLFTPMNITIAAVLIIGVVWYTRSQPQSRR